MTGQDDRLEVFSVGDEQQMARIRRVVAEVGSDDWMGYSDDLGDNAGRCELFAGPKIDGYRTGSVFAVNEDCECGCHPPTPEEMSFIETARWALPLLLAEFDRTAGATS